MDINDAKKVYKILACDDDIDIVNSIKIYLRAEGYNVVTASNGKEALEIIKGDIEIGLALLDVMMPEMDGFETVMAIREAGYKFPVILVTAKGASYDKVLGFKAGTDDYVTKPFDHLELVARVNAHYKRYIESISKPNGPDGPDGPIYRNGPIVIYDGAKRVEVNGTPVELTPTEYSILKVFVQNAGVVMSPKELYSKAWDEDPYGNENTVLVHIRHIRQKIEIDPASPRFIVSVFGHGYKMERLG